MRNRGYNHVKCKKEKKKKGTIAVITERLQVVSVPQYF